MYVRTRNISGYKPRVTFLHSDTSVRVALMQPFAATLKRSLRFCLKQYRPNCLIWRMFVHFY